uniref:Uncharacterized protein n=1 Tax=Magallana gigas TaxID=29159 RepID=K1RIN1_MAGGI
MLSYSLAAPPLPHPPTQDTRRKNAQRPCRCSEEALGNIFSRRRHNLFKQLNIPGPEPTRFLGIIPQIKEKIKGVGDKRQITTVLALSKSGDLLSPQLLDQGPTDKCHPKEVKAALASGVDVEGVNIDLRLLKIKPVLAKWLMHANEHLADRELIASAFEKA